MSFSQNLKTSVILLVALSAVAMAKSTTGKVTDRVGDVKIQNAKTGVCFENVCEDDNNVTKPYVLHAEANAITKLARSNNNSDGATIYITASPCIECAKLIIQAGIRRVVYGEQYRLTDGIDLLKRAGIEVIFMDVNDQ